MRLVIKTTDKPELGETRQREGFLMIPRIIGDEIRWLCRARWIQVWRKTWCQPPETRGYETEAWCDERWI